MIVNPAQNQAKPELEFFLDRALQYDPGHQKLAMPVPAAQRDFTVRARKIQSTLWLIQHSNNISDISGAAGDPALESQPNGHWLQLLATGLVTPETWAGRAKQKNKTLKKNTTTRNAN